jgi:hypothetical protein
MFCVIIFIPFFTGILETKFLENIPDGSPEFILIMLIFLVFVSLFTLIPTKIVHFLANRYIKMSSPSSEILASNTLCFKIDTENKDSKINSLITMIRKLFDYDLLKNKSDINNDHWLLKSNNQSIDFILIYYLKDILIITPFKNLIYEYNFNTIKLKNSIYDLMLVIYEFEPVDTKTDTNARDAFSDYLKMFQDYSVKKSEIREVFPTIKLIFYGAISIVVILGIFFSYPRIPELLQYLETTGSTGIIIGTIAGAIIVGILSYIYKSLKKKIFNK